MKYIQWYHDDFVNGEGIREVIFIPGCNHKCKGCFNPESWNFNQGKLWTSYEDTLLTSKLKNPYCSGITLTGGDPLYSYPEVLEFCKKYKDYNIWVYTGFTLEEVKRDFSELLEYVDVVITEPYIIELNSPKKEWVGSSNQIIYKTNKK